MARKGPSVSHIFFADDLLLFGKARVSQMKAIMELLNSFCEASGQSKNPSKSKIYVSPNLPKRQAREIRDVCGFGLVNNLGKYLGTPLLHGRFDKTTFQERLDKVNARLSAWKSNFLPLAGRATLIQSVRQSIPMFIMHTNYLPSLYEADWLPLT